MDLLPRASAEFERIVSTLPRDAWDNPTPCDISVREVVDHVVAGNQFSALLVSGADRESARAVLVGDHLGDDPSTAVRESCVQHVDAFAAADPGIVVATPVGDLSVETFRWIRVGDLVVHAWDVARGAGLPEDLDPDVVAELWELTGPRRNWMRETGAYGGGGSDDLPGDASPQHRLLDAFGRRP